MLEPPASRRHVARRLTGRCALVVVPSVAALALWLASLAPAQAQWGPPAARSNTAVLEAYRSVVATPRLAPKPGSPVCPACKEIYQQLKK